LIIRPVYNSTQSTSCSIVYYTQVNTCFVLPVRVKLLRKIRSGIYGLNPLLDCGVNENSTTVVIGRSGAGNTTLATQFIRRGLQEGQEGVFVSLDENKEQIIREAVEMGWADILEYSDVELLLCIG